MYKIDIFFSRCMEQLEFKSGCKLPKPYVFYVNIDLLWKKILCQGSPRSIPLYCDLFSAGSPVVGLNHHCIHLSTTELDTQQIFVEEICNGHVK